MTTQITKQEFILAFKKGLLFTSKILPSSLKVGNILNGKVVTYISQNFIELENNNAICCGNGANDCEILTQISDNVFISQAYYITSIDLFNDNAITNMSYKQAKNELEWYLLECHLANVLPYETFVSELKYQILRKSIIAKKVSNISFSLKYFKNSCIKILI